MISTDGSGAAFTISLYETEPASNSSFPANSAVILAVPAATRVIFPSASIVATSVLSLLYVTARLFSLERVGKLFSSLPIVTSREATPHERPGAFFDSPINSSALSKRIFFDEVLSNFRVTEAVPSATVTGIV